MTIQQMVRPAMGGDVRRRILADPEIILGDREVMAALAGPGAGAGGGGNVVDLRGMAMARLEARLDRLEETHRGVIAAAYENVAGTQQIHRAILRLLEAEDLDAFVGNLGARVAQTLRVESVVLVLEQPGRLHPDAAGALRHAPPGYVARYAARGRPVPARQVTLRQLPEGEAGLHGSGEGVDWVASEAVIALDLGEGRPPAMLVLGCEDPEQFTPGQGVDLLAFFGGVVERALRRWL